MRIDKATKIINWILHYLLFRKVCYKLLTLNYQIDGYKCVGKIVESFKWISFRKHHL